MKDVNGNPLANTKIDMWQADTNGEYSYFADGIPDDNLRGVFIRMRMVILKLKQLYRVIIQFQQMGLLVSS